MVKRKERSVYTSKGGILTRVISTRLTKLAKYSKALSSSRFLPSLPLYFHHQSSTFAPLLTTTSFLFLLSVFFFFLYFSFTLVCVYVRVFVFFSLPPPPHPDCVRVTRGSFQFPLLRAASDFEVSSISSRCFHSRSLFFFRRFFSGLRTYFSFLFFVSFWFDLEGGVDICREVDPKGFWMFVGETSDLICFYQETFLWYLLLINLFLS